MIADDMMTFIKSDIIVFGLGVLLFIIVLFGLYLENLFGSLFRLVVVFSVIIMMGLLVY